MTAEVIDLAVVRGAIARATVTPQWVEGKVAEVRTALQVSLTGLAELRAADAHHVAFGPNYSWALACELWFGDLRALRLSGSEAARTEREHLIWSLREDGATTRAIRDRLDVSAYAVQEALRKLDPAPERVTGADGAQRPARTGRVERPAAPTGHKWQQAAVWLGRATDGLTLAELAEVAGWSEGSASGVLSDLRRRGLAVRGEDRRGGMRVHRAVQP